MVTISLELLLPLSRFIDPKATGRVTVVEDIAPGETVGSFLTRAARKYPGLRSVFDVDKQELRPMVLLVLDDAMLTSSESLDRELAGGETVCLLPQHVGGTMPLDNLGRDR